MLTLGISLILIYLISPLIGKAIFAARSFVLAEVVVSGNDIAFNWISLWLIKDDYSRRCTSLIGTTRGLPRSIDDDDRDHEGIFLRFIPAQGVHFIRKGFRFLLIRRKSGITDYTQKPIEEFRFVSWRKNAIQLKELLEDIKEQSFPKHHQSVIIFGYNYDDWVASGKAAKRPISTIYTDNNISIELLEDARRFFDSDEFYTKRGIPHRRGYLLYGPPGNGKSSLSLSLASELGCNIYQLPLDAQTNNETLRISVSGIPPGNIVLIEDVDQAFQKRDSKNANHITFSGVLNCLDGLGAGRSLLLIMTTNYIDQLDSALIRPGRIDKKVFLGYPSDDQIRRIFDTFFPGQDADSFIKAVPGNTSIAAIQNILLRSEGIDQALSLIREYSGDPNSERTVGFAA